MAAKRWTEEEMLEHNGQCPEHGAVLEVRVIEDKELGGKRTLYTCRICVDEETGPGGQVCKSCGHKISWATTPGGKKMPLDIGATTVRLENGDWAKAHISHFITCPQSELHRKPTITKVEDPGDGPPTPPRPDEPTERRSQNQRPRTGAPWDKCRDCGTATNWKESDQLPRRDKKPGFVVFENWDCPDGCGHWWKIKGSRPKPSWSPKK